LGNKNLIISFINESWKHSFCFSYLWIDCCLHLTCLWKRLHSNNVIDNSNYRLILKLDKGDANKSPQLVRHTKMSKIALFGCKVCKFLYCVRKLLPYSAQMWNVVAISARNIARVQTHKSMTKFAGVKRNSWPLRNTWPSVKAHTDRTRFGNATRIFSFQWYSTIFQCFSNIRDHLSNFSYLVCISCKIVIRWRFYLFLKTENSRRVAESRPVNA
jgi:hypothetical protein